MMIVNACLQNWTTFCDKFSLTCNNPYLSKQLQILINSRQIQSPLSSVSVTPSDHLLSHVRRRASDSLTFSGFAVSRFKLPSICFLTRRRRVGMSLVQDPNR